MTPGNGHRASNLSTTTALHSQSETFSFPEHSISGMHCRPFPSVLSA